MRLLTLAKTAGAVPPLPRSAGWRPRPRCPVGLVPTAEQAGLPTAEAGLPIAWNILYTDIAVVSASTIDTLNDRGETAAAQAYTRALAANLALNAGWSWIFFNRRQLGPASVVAGRWRSAAPIWRDVPQR